MYRPSLGERLGLDDPFLIKAAAWSLPFATLLAALGYYRFSAAGTGAAVLAGAVGFVVGMVFTAGGALLVAGGGARAGAAALLPSGRSTPVPRDFSAERALVARGAVSEALRRLEERLAETPEDVETLTFLAELYAREGSDPRRAAALFLRAQAMPGVSASGHLYATNRLVDLFMGPLDDPEQVLAHLDRLIQRHPGTREAGHAERLRERLRG